MMDVPVHPHTALTGFFFVLVFILSACPVSRTHHKYQSGIKKKSAWPSFLMFLPSVTRGSPIPHRQTSPASRRDPPPACLLCSPPHIAARPNPPPPPRTIKPRRAIVAERRRAAAAVRVGLPPPRSGGKAQPTSGLLYVSLF
jgi:hypothetical protein